MSSIKEQRADQNMYANRNNLTAKELSDVINSYSNAISTMLDLATFKYQLDETERNKLLKAIEGASNKLDEFKILLDKKQGIHKGGRKTLRKRKSDKNQKK